MNAAPVQLKGNSSRLLAAQELAEIAGIVGYAKLQKLQLCLESFFFAT
jgi:hypothetical protein